MGGRLIGVEGVLLSFVANEQGFTLLSIELTLALPIYSP